MFDNLSRRGLFGVAGAAGLAALGLTSTTAATATPDAPQVADAQEALDRLLAGNRRFVEARMEHPGQDPEHRLRVSEGQRPFATILTCSDSRLPPEVLFDQGLGDLFVVRVAGNIVDAALLGSIEYAVEHLGTPLVLVMGHEKCGAVEATLESLEHHEVPHNDVAALVHAITPAAQIAQRQPGDVLDNAVRANTEQSLRQIAAAPEVADHLAAGRVRVVAAYYHLADGHVSLL